MNSMASFADQKVVIWPALPTPRVSADIPLAQPPRFRQESGPIVRITSFSEHVDRRYTAFDPITAVHELPDPLASIRAT